MIIGGMESRRFTLVRHDDVTGVSGTGVVADGVRFPDGVVALRHAPNGLPLLVRRAEGRCSCREDGALDNETITVGAE